MSLTPAQAPSNAIFHRAAETDDGLRVVDVCETREANEQFAQEQIDPHSQQVGVPGAPESTYYEVQNVSNA